MPKKFIYSNCNGAKSSFSKIRKFLQIFTFCTAVFLGECLTEIKLYPFLPETDSVINGRGISAHFGKDGPLQLIKSDKFDIITTEWCSDKQEDGKHIPIILTSVYRNQSTEKIQDFLTEILTLIQETQKLLQNPESAQVIIWGDFNCTSDQCEKLTEQIDGLYLAGSPSHQHLPNSSVTFIDHIFMNDKIEVDFHFHDPLENKPTSLSTTTDKLGHKTMELSFPDVDQLTQDIQQHTLDYKIFDRYLNFKIPVLRRIWNDTKQDTEHKTQQTLNFIQTAINKATKIKTFKTVSFTESKDYFISNNLFSTETNHGKSPTANFYKTAKRIMKCSYYEADMIRREDSVFAEFLQKKLNTVPPAPREPKKDIKTDETFRLDKVLKISSQLIKKFMKSFSSGARDKFSSSGKVMKHMAENDDFVEIFTIMVNEILKTGEIPMCMRQDFIFGLYKNKGKLTEASSFRPISISCWSLKLVEKTLVHFLRQHDLLTENDSHGLHAYRSGFNCSTALLHLDHLLCKLNKITNEKSKITNLDCKVAVFVDYKGAFEGISTNCVIQSISHPVLQKLVRFSLIRNVMVGTHKLVYQTWKSIPQGSCISPWVFNRANLQVLEYVRKKWKEHGIQAEITGFADDNCCVTTVGQAKRAIDILIQAIDKFGFCFEPKKTEILMCSEAIDANSTFELRLTDSSTGTRYTFKPKTQLKWLGFIVKMNHDGLQIIFEGQLRNIINMFKAAVTSCSPQNKRAIYDIYVSPIIRMYAVFEDVSRFEQKITDFIQPVKPLKPALQTMKNFMLKTLKMNLKSDNNDMIRRINDFQNDDWNSLEVRMLQRLSSSA